MRLDPTIENFSYDSLGNIEKLTFIGSDKNGEKNTWVKIWNGEISYKIIETEYVYDDIETLKWTVIRKHKYYNK